MARSRTLRYPFQHKRVLGPGPRGRKIKERRFWVCRCNNYVCSCRGAGGQSKRFRFNPKVKAKYGHDYRVWARSRAGRSRAGVTRMAAYGDTALHWGRSSIAPERVVAGTTRGVYAVYPIGDRRFGLAFIPMRGHPMELGYFKSMVEAKRWAGKHASREMWSHVA